MLRVTWPILNRVRDCCRSIQAFEPKRWNGPVLPLSNFAQTQYGYKGITNATHLRDAEAGLMSFGADGSASVRHGAKFVQRILQGRQPKDLPIEQPTKYDRPSILNLQGHGRHDSGNVLD